MNLSKLRSLSGCCPHPDTTCIWPFLGRTWNWPHRSRRKWRACASPKTSWRKQWDTSVVAQLFRRDPLRASHPSDNLHGDKPWGHQRKQHKDYWSCGKKGLVPDWEPPQAAGSQSSVSAFQGATESSRKETLLKMSRNSRSKPSACFSTCKGFKQTIDICKGLYRFKDLLETLWVFSFQTCLKIARLKALGSLLT